MDTERSRLKWLCRRGMRELDIVTSGYLENRYETADDAEKAAFRRLLELPDPDLFGYLTGREAPPDEGLAGIVDVIRSLRNAGS